MADTQQGSPKILLLTKPLEKTPSGGRALLCKLNHDALRALYGGQLVVFELPAVRPRGLSGALNAFRGHIDGLNTMSMAAALRVIERERVSKVFIDGSNLGAFAAYVKRHRPQIEVVSFFHNVEARFFWGSLLSQKSPRALAVLVANYLTERKAVRHSDKLVCLSARDSTGLQKLYGHGATHIAPMALEDKFSDVAPMPDQHQEPFALFVGGAFYANRNGITWFVRYVAPHIDVPVFIVGRGFENYREALEIPGKVTVIGAVENMAEWYQRAQFVIAPIFDGSGMKTKVAEALMFGKRVIGTPEAFSGYDDISVQIGWVCKTADEFIAATGEAQHSITARFDPAMRALYEENYSTKAAQMRLAAILNA